MTLPVSAFYVDLESALEQLAVNGCDHCQGDIDIHEVLSDRFGLYAEVLCLIGGTEKCFDRIQKVRL